MVGFFFCNTHCSKDYGETLSRTGHFCLTGDLQCNIVVRKTSTRKDRKLLATDKRVGTIYGRDTGLDEIRRHATGVWVDCSTGDVETLLRDNLRATVNRLTATRQDPAEHVSAHRHLDGFSRETDTAVPADTGRGLKDLDNDQLIAGVKYLPALG